MIINILLCVLFSYLITYLFIPIFKKNSWVSSPNQRTSHMGIIPVGGSLGFIFVSSINFILNKEYLIGITLTFLIALTTIKLFMNFIQKMSLNIFVIYRIFLGLIILIFVYLN